ncbi:MAG: hypothetical protein OIN84_05345 [Candidatus Methanoperedens sp.]|uniref:hypothetical protein n=1 Tax=Candidatus Methanoperedens sp. BLZ2 TaxID=2035255 RepID=UPI0020D0E80A|nr:hypothetical protein [Candidatus Methanoperedens sp. BLZ2]MCX9077386.1 hypothetical protein [Candidatus Methanoperedens sp.]
MTAKEKQGALTIKDFDKLLKLEIDICKKCQIVAGIAKSHVLANLWGSWSL